MTKNDFAKALEKLKHPSGAFPDESVFWFTDDELSAVEFALKAQIDAKPLPEDVQRAVELFNETAVFLMPENKKYRDALETLIRAAKSGGEKMTTTNLAGALKPCPFKPAFQIGDIVEIGGEYAGDWRGTLHFIGEVTWNKKKNCIQYGTYQIDTNDGMTTDWSEENLILVKSTRALPDQRTGVEEVTSKQFNANLGLITKDSMTFAEAVYILYPNGVKIIADRGE